MNLTGLSAYVRPDELWGIGATVTGSVDEDYEAGWLMDGRARRPVRGPGVSPEDGALSLSMSAPVGDIGLVAIAHHNLIVPVTIGGDVSATITPAATRPPNGIPLNAFALVSPEVTGVDSLTLSVTGNDHTVVIGEFFAGKVRSLVPVRIDGAQFSHSDASDDARARTGVPEYDRGEEGRVLSGTQVYTTEQLAEIKAWWQAQRGGSLPSLIVPDPDVNDIWVVKFSGLSYSPVRSNVAGDGLWLVTLTFIEVPRVRW